VNLGRSKDMEEAGFDLTPMIDVVLLLIIFFMLTAQFAKSLNTPLDLPTEPGERAPAGGESELVIDILRDGTLRVEGNNVGIERLMQMLAADQNQAKARSSRLDVLVRADRRCPAAHLNGLAGQMASLGIRDWRLATARAEGGGS